MKRYIIAAGISLLVVGLFHVATNPSILAHLKKVH